MKSLFLSTIAIASIIGLSGSSARAAEPLTCSQGNAAQKFACLNKRVTDIEDLLKKTGFKLMQPANTSGSQCLGTQSASATQPALVNCGTAKDLQTWKMSE